MLELLINQIVTLSDCKNTKKPQIGFQKMQKTFQNMQNPMFPDILGMVFCGNLFIFALNIDFDTPSIQSE